MDASYLIGAGAAHAQAAVLGGIGKLYSRSRIIGLDAQGDWILHNLTFALKPTMDQLNWAGPGQLSWMLTPKFVWVIVRDASNKYIYEPVEGDAAKQTWDQDGVWILNKERQVRVFRDQLIWVEIEDVKCNFEMSIAWFTDEDFNFNANNYSKRIKTVQWPHVEQDEQPAD